MNYVMIGAYSFYYASTVVMFIMNILSINIAIIIIIIIIIIIFFFIIINVIASLIVSLYHCSLMHFSLFAGCYFI